MTAYSSLSQLADGKRIVSIEAGDITAPSHAGHPGTHLIVNCLFHSDLAQLSPPTLLATSQTETIFILKHLVANKLLDGIVSVNLSFYEAPDSQRLRPRRRIYRFGTIVSSLPRDAATINESCFIPSNETIQSSQFDEITSLLAEKRSSFVLR
jgi:hypothetical protein